jgi:undecaprenyl phosphate-alpha-L-ara4FN deformylase
MKNDTPTVFVIKIDVDTDKGTKIGVPNLITLLNELKIPATFLFSLGPDNTGLAVKRIFRKGFLKKVLKTNVAGNYGFPTLLYGTLLPAPHIGNRRKSVMQQTQEKGFEVGIHCYDHTKWQDSVSSMTQEQIDKEFGKAVNEFQNIFNTDAKTAGAPGWQANEKTLSSYDKAKIAYASDCRGTRPFYPKVAGITFKTLQIPTTLPTLDELLGNPEFPEEKLTAHFLSLLKSDQPNIITIHAELEGMKYLPWFKSFLLTLQKQNTQFKTLKMIAEELGKQNIPVCELIQKEIEGRSGKLAIQGNCNPITS